MSKQRNSGKGFTIIELLTVMSVIAILIGLLVPALNLVHDLADEVQQKAQFHGLEVAIEMFKSEYGFYPPSNDNQWDPTAVDPTPYGGAQKLAEALVGWDLVGFHPRSDFRSDGTFTHDNGSGGVVTNAPAYHLGSNYAGGGNPLFAETDEEGIKARTPFMDLENANAFSMENVYGTDLTPLTSGGTAFEATNFVICDEYAKKRATGKKTGMPVLYWRADTNRTMQESDVDNDVPADGIPTNDDVFNFDDNAGMLGLLTAEQVDLDARIDGSEGIEFDQFIANENVTATTAGFIRPYRASSYILISAGKDGYYGTADDVTNFNKTE